MRINNWFSVDSYHWIHLAKPHKSQQRELQSTQIFKTSDIDSSIILHSIVSSWISCYGTACRHCTKASGFPIISQQTPLLIHHRIAVQMGLSYRSEKVEEQKSQLVRRRSVVDNVIIHLQLETKQSWQLWLVVTRIKSIHRYPHAVVTCTTQVNTSFYFTGINAISDKHDPVFPSILTNLFWTGQSIN